MAPILRRMCRIYVLALVIEFIRFSCYYSTFVTYVLYRKNKIRPRFRVPTRWTLYLLFLGGTSLCPHRKFLSFNLCIRGLFFPLWCVQYPWRFLVLRRKLKTISNVALELAYLCPSRFIPGRTLAKLTNLCWKMLMRERISILEWWSLVSTAGAWNFVHTAETSVFGNWSCGYLLSRP